MTLFNQGRFREAKEKFQQAINAAPNEFKHLYKNNLDKATAEVLHEEALAFHRQGNYQAAISKFNEALKILPSGEINRRTQMKDNLAETHNAYGEQLYNRSDFRSASAQFKLAISNASQTNPKRNKYQENYTTSEWEILIVESEELREKIRKIVNDDGDSTRQKMQYFEDALSRINLAIETIPKKYLNRLSDLKSRKASTHEEFGDLLMSKSDFETARFQFMSSLETIEGVQGQNNSSFKMRINNKITDAQVGFFNTEYTSIMTEVNELSNEIAVEKMVKLLDSYKATADRDLAGERRENLHKQLEILIKSLLSRRSFSQAVKAANIGKQYFPEKSKLYDEILEEKKKQDFDQDHLKNKFETYVDEKMIKAGQQQKFMSR